MPASSPGSLSQSMPAPVLCEAQSFRWSSSCQQPPLRVLCPFSCIGICHRSQAPEKAENVQQQHADEKAQKSPSGSRPYPDNDRCASTCGGKTGTQHSDKRDLEILPETKRRMHKEHTPKHYPRDTRDDQQVHDLHCPKHNYVS